MKVYFTASISQQVSYSSYYDRIIQALEKLGHSVQHQHITGKSMDNLKVQTDEEHHEHYKRVLKWISNADVTVVEASFPSTLNIGHEISLALERGKPVIVLYKKGQKSYFLDASESDKLIALEYDDVNLEELVSEGLDYAKDQADTRFNFFISPRHVSYLDWIAKTKRVPRSVYLRGLIKTDMEKNQAS